MSRLIPVLLVLASCGGAEGPARGEQGPPVRTETEKGPVKVTVEVAPGKPRLSDEPTMTITIDAAEGVKVTPPPFGTSLGGFVVRDFREPLPESRDGRLIHRQIYRLEPVAAGEQTILPIPISFEVDGKTHTLETESLVVEVTSLLGDETPSLDDLRSAAGPVPFPAEPSPFGWIAAGVVVLLASASIWWMRKRRRSQEAGPQLSPAELAHHELLKLMEDDPLSRGEVQTFYVELTAIVRRYIERTTGIRAPEQTTDEFLRAMRGHEAFADDRKEGLRAFLESADLVKFAAVRPSGRDIEESFVRAKQFVGVAA